MEILFFHAPWCGPCKAYIKNELPKIKKKHEVHIIDCQEDPFTADKYGIRHIPTLIVQKDGKEVYRGAGKAEQVLEAIAKA